MKNENTIEQKNMQKAAALNCTFTRVRRNNRTALLARISVPIVRQATAENNRLETLLDHAANLNVRLPLLKVSVKANSLVTTDEWPSERAPGPYAFVLHGLFSRRITSQNLAHFLDLLTRDFNSFVAYAKVHNVEILPPGGRTQTPSLLA